jgi:nucleotidyltransferase/DNA polymerase involved in DNA repair
MTYTCIYITLIWSDEAFLDITELALKRMLQTTHSDVGYCETPQQDNVTENETDELNEDTLWPSSCDWPQHTHIVLSDEEASTEEEHTKKSLSVLTTEKQDHTTSGLSRQCTDWFDILLCFGAKIAQDIRAAIHDQLGYTSSAGMSYCIL